MLFVPDVIPKFRKFILALKGLFL